MTVGYLRWNSSINCWSARRAFVPAIAQEAGEQLRCQPCWPFAATRAAAGARAERARAAAAGCVPAKRRYSSKMAAMDQWLTARRQPTKLPVRCLPWLQWIRIGWYR